MAGYSIFLKRAVLFTALMLIALSLCGKTWTHRNGRTIEAELIDVKGEQAQFRLSSGGRVFYYPIGELCQKDQDFIVNEQSSRERERKHALGDVILQVDFENGIQPDTLVTLGYSIGLVTASDFTPRIQVVAEVGRGRNRLDLDDVPEDCKILYILAEGCAPQYIRLQRSDNGAIEDMEVTLYRLRYVSIRWVALSEGRDFSASDAVERRCAITQWRSPETKYAWKLNQVAHVPGAQNCHSAGEPGSLPSIDYWQIFGRWGLQESELPFDSMQEAPPHESQWFSGGRFSLEPGTRYFFSGPPDYVGAAKMEVEAVSLTAPTDREVLLFEPRLIYSDKDPITELADRFFALALRVAEEPHAADLRANELANVVSELRKNVDPNHPREIRRDVNIALRQALSRLGSELASGRPDIQPALLAIAKTRGDYHLWRYVPDAFGTAAAEGHEPSLAILLNYETNGMDESRTIRAFGLLAEDLPNEVRALLVATAKESNDERLLRGIRSTLERARDAGDALAARALEELESI
ncbi:MAG: hypothetical protein ACOCVG_02410 [Verrucomicrobiota bacterium]